MYILYDMSGKHSYFRASFQCHLIRSSPFKSLIIMMAIYIQATTEISFLQLVCYIFVHIVAISVYIVAISVYIVAISVYTAKILQLCNFIVLIVRSDWTIF